MSWGSAESSNGCSSETAEHAYFAAAAATGTILVGASGDNGAKDGTRSPTPDYPSADPSVVGAGGTSIALTSSGAYSSETVWNDASGASGGGVSKCFTEPTYQSSHSITVKTSTGSSTPTGRAVPDVSYNADPYTGFWIWDTTGYSGWVQIGGTSAAAPQWAAIFADALSAGDTGLTGSTVLGLIYSLPSTAVHDVTSGNNGYYYASAGYDATTGVGSPVEASVVASL
jgi:kumamolisin